VIRVTQDDGKSWQDVTPKELTPWSKVVMMDASHFDANEAYAAIDRHRLTDNEPYIYRTKDGGKSWQKITRGLPPGVYMQTVKEDPKRRGLMAAGTELGVFISFNDGDEWQPLQLNLPATSNRDLAFHDNDLIVATHGRGWVLDDVSVLRQIGSRSAQPTRFSSSRPTRSSSRRRPTMGRRRRRTSRGPRVRRSARSSTTTCNPRRAVRSCSRF
jgi:hypothetical protein